MFTVGVYSGLGDKLGEAFIQGARKQGWIVKLRSANDFRTGDTEDFTLAFIYTMRTRASDTIIQCYRPRLPRVPVVVIDYGYLRRACQEQFGSGEGYWQMAIDSETGLNSIPSFECPPDRFEALKLDIHAEGGDPSGVVLVCGQHVGDPSHGRMSAEALSKWADEQITYWTEQGRKVIFRPHPFSPDVLPSYPECKIADPAKYTLEKVLSRTALVVCQNSNIGHDALLAGVPVVCTREDAPYKALTGEELPSVEDRLAYFSRVAYAQWTLAEIANGDWASWYEKNRFGFEAVAALSPTVSAPAITGSFEATFLKGLNS